MKNKHACAFAALLLAAMIAAIIINCSFVKRTTDHILSSLTELSNSASSAELRKLAEYWDERRKIFAVSLSESELDRISSLFDDLIADSEGNDPNEYKKTMARLKRAIEDIRKFEEFSLENIF